MLQELYKLHCCDHDLVKLADNKEWDSIFEDFAKHAYDGNGNMHLPTYFKTAQQLAASITEGIGSTYEHNDPANSLAAALRSNLYQFSGAKTMFEHKLLTGMITGEDGEKIPFKDYLEKVKGINKTYNQKYLEAEYNNAIAGATMSLKWKNLESIGAEYLEYRTVGDELVRASHQKLDLLVLPIDSPVWDRIYPPNDWGCRCTVVPADKPKNGISDADAGKLGKEAVTKPMFETNVGKTEVIYDKGHPYFKNVKGKLQELDAEKNYGMKSISSIMKNAEDFTTPVVIDDYNKWWDDMVKKNGINKSDFVLKDPFGTNILFESRTGTGKAQDYFKDHITRKKEGREKYAANILDILKNPDEVWSKGQKDNQEFQYIKYYNDAPYLLTVVRRNGELKAETFYKIDNDKYKAGDIRLKRTGVLMLKNN